MTSKQVAIPHRVNHCCMFFILLYCMGNGMVWTLRAIPVNAQKLIPVVFGYHVVLRIEPRTLACKACAQLLELSS